MKRLVIVCAAMLLAPGPAGAGDRIFADRFEHKPCCQIGGTVTGLAGTSLVLHLAAGSISENRAIHANGAYDFATSVVPGTAWAVNVATQPSGQTCQLVNASGTTGSGHVNNVDANCAGADALIWDQGRWDDGTWW